MKVLSCTGERAVPLGFRDDHRLGYTGTVGDETNRLTRMASREPVQGAMLLGHAANLEGDLLGGMPEVPKSLNTCMPACPRLVYIDQTLPEQGITGEREPMSQTQTPRDAKAELKAAKAYAKATRPWYKKKRFWLLAIIALIVIFAITSGGDDETTTDGSSTTTSQGTSESSDAPAEVAAVVVTAQKLIGDLEENALAASETYKGKRVTVTGTLNNVDASGDYFTLKGTEDFSLTNVQVFIEEDQVKTVSGFKAGQEVTVTGEVTDVGEILGYSIKAETIG